MSGRGGCRFDYLKLKVGRDLEDDIRRVRITREVLGPDRKLMIDANQIWETNEAIPWVNQLAFANPWFIEEPTNPDDIEGHRRIRQVLLRSKWQRAKCARTALCSNNSSCAKPLTWCK